MRQQAHLTKSEKVHEALNILMKDRMVIIIAHRLARFKMLIRL